MERWPSGLRRTLGKRVESKGFRRFKSCPLRQEKNSQTTCPATSHIDEHAILWYDIFMEFPDETGEVAAFQQEIDLAYDEYLASEQRVRELSGIRRLFGKSILRHARKTAVTHGVGFANDYPIHSRAVSLREFNAIDDDNFEPYRN